MSQIASIPALNSASACLHARTGAFVLAPAHALTLLPKQHSSLRITCGQAWVTMDDGTDYFLAAEQRLRLPAGSRVVMENLQRGTKLKFDWQTEAAALSLQSQAWRDLRAAGGLLALGLRGLGAATVTLFLGALGAGFARGSRGFSAFFGKTALRG